MPFNLPGALVPLYALFNPRLLLPSVVVRDIRHLDWAALRDAGYRGAVFDKDNCLTIPHDDTLVPELETAWAAALRTFGPTNVLIVSNSAGTRADPSQLQADSVAHHLHARVLLHGALKPAYACADAALAALPNLAPHELVVVGDRVFTDVVLARRLAQPRTLWARVVARLRPAPEPEPGESGGAPLAVWTTGVWQREATAMRWAEARLVQLAERWVDGARERRAALEARFVRLPTERGVVPPEERPAAGWFGWTRRLVVRSRSD
ncbi:mitochondrial PGP phosphatase-domain-containing protein [Gloeopeniophorella convolvens]|nr:mitochondrial PGP phosphatase-domain-containing protein [Gloeopeniophorella convolvens]